MKDISIKTIINAPIQKVWETLINIKDYSKWNPFVYDISFDKKIPEVNCNMLFSVRFSNGKEVKSKEFVTTFKPPKLNNNKSALWVYRFDGFLHKPYMVRATRIQKLKALSENKTEYLSEEVFSGLLKAFLPVKEVTKGFILQSNVLKELCEAK